MKNLHQSLIDRMHNENYHLVSIDLFSGPGGLCTGFKWAGILPLIAVEWTDSTVETYSVSHNTDVFELSEYNKDGITNDSYLEKFCTESTKSLMIHGDINKVESWLIRHFLLTRYGIDSENETIDIVSGGAPCESFSMAGKRTANDERDDLFSNILRIARTLRSKSVLFENVKGMFSKAKNGKKGAIFNYICDSFEDDNADVVYRLMSRKQDEILLKACDYGVPQVRERLFLIGVRSDLDNIKIKYPVKKYGPEREYPYVTSWEAISDLPIINSKEEKTSYTLPNNYMNDNQERFVSIMRGLYNDEYMNTNVPQYLIDKGLFAENTVSVHKGPGHIPRKIKLLEQIRVNESMKSAFARIEAEGNMTPDIRALFPKTIYGSRNRRLIQNEPSFTVTSHCLDEILHPYLIRAITPREAARLQSFPDWYQFAGPYVQFHGSKEQDKYEQIGDAIPPLLACAIAKEFIISLPNHANE